MVKPMKFFYCHYVVSIETDGYMFRLHAMTRGINNLSPLNGRVHLRDSSVSFVGGESERLNSDQATECLYLLSCDDNIEDTDLESIEEAYQCA